MGDTPLEEKRKLIEANRERYAALKSTAQGKVPKALPERTKSSESELADSCLIHRETIPGGWYWSTVLQRGEALRIVNVTGTSSVSLLAWNKDDTSERLEPRGYGQATMEYGDPKGTHAPLRHGPSVLFRD